MGVVYTFLIYCYGFFLGFAALFNKKARRWVSGRRGIFNELSRAFAGVDHARNPVIWFHAASLGEFEQGRPVIEAIRRQWPEKKILLTFFSPSGFDVRKKYDQADFIFYLPLDTPANVHRFLDIVKPETVFFIKYDFWFNYIREIQRRRIRLFFISALFRKDHYFFVWYGSWFRRQLGNVNHFFVQDTGSAQLLKAIGIKEVTIAGDTRFDRVYEIAASSISLPLIEKFCGTGKIFVAGSSWEPDEAVFMPLIARKMPGMKFIIAPHDTSPGRIRELTLKCPARPALYSEMAQAAMPDADVLIIDCVGMLANIYRYATVAFIGGGFGSGLHNIQEAVTFGVPVFFGPAYHKFTEAIDLVELGGAFCVRDSDELIAKVQVITGDPSAHARVSTICKDYVEKHRGATEKIVSYCDRQRIITDQ